jgi:hypothetical protein
MREDGNRPSVLGTSPTALKKENRTPPQNTCGGGALQEFSRGFLQELCRAAKAAYRIQFQTKETGARLLLRQLLAE